MIVTVFRSRVRPEAQQEYQQWASRISALAEQMPGHISHKSFVAEDGERLTLVEFESAQAQQAWSLHPEHVQAKHKGSQDFYLEYHLQVCEVVRESRSPLR